MNNGQPMFWWNNPTANSGEMKWACLRLAYNILHQQNDILRMNMTLKPF